MLTVLARRSYGDEVVNLFKQVNYFESWIRSNNLVSWVNNSRASSPIGLGYYILQLTDTILGDYDKENTTQYLFQRTDNQAVTSNHLRLVLGMSASLL